VGKELTLKLDTVCDVILCVCVAVIGIVSAALMVALTIKIFSEVFL
jgi:hypothetical protein